jgi:hypothetical protein
MFTNKNSKYHMLMDIHKYSKVIIILQLLENKRPNLLINL